MLEFEKAWTKGTANSARFIKLLLETGIGESLFGFSFRPQHIMAKDPVIGNFVAFFLNGGNYEKLKPTNEMVKYLELTRTAVKSGAPVHEYAGNQRDKLPLIADMVEQLGYENRASEIRDALKLPLNAKELDITGHDIMNMGYHGREIGQILNNLLKAVHNHKVENNYNKLKEYI